MKILFTITVLIAGIYLFIQQKGLEKLNKFLPQHQIEQATETLLANVSKNVDQQLEQFKNKVLNKKDERINELENQLQNLQTQFLAKAGKEKTQLIQQKERPQDFPPEQTFSATQYLAAESSMHLPSTLSSPTAQPSDKEFYKQRAIKRQANLQDIAERMNKTSLLALTN
ncbi:hypothetical protein [Colwellia sp. TT2012]|uniref:hypothetical protein n=1 Tax=Colwellia sp. TT2012 TaxID=1720342 RepID=UPI00070F6614|nr:hypothetical protein [Colwellia sp. TT2012]